MKSSFTLLVSCLILLNSAFALTQQDVSISTKGTIEYSVKFLRADELYSFSYEDRNNVTKLSENLDLYITYHQQVWITDDLHDLKPSMKVLIYRNLRDINDHNTDEWELASNNSWFLLDSNGSMIHHEQWTHDWMVDIGNPDYQAWVAGWIKDKIEIYGFDGVLADYGLECSVPTWGMSGHPIDPRTGQLYTDDEWVNDLTTLINKITDVIGPKLYFCNGIHNGQKWFWRRESYERVFNQSRIDGFMSEGLFTASSRSGGSSWYTEEQWRQSLDFLVWVQNSFLTRSNKIYGAWAWSHSDQESAFIIASFLLGVDKFSQNYVTARTQMVSDYAKRLAQIDLGSPIESYQVVGGTHVYERDFTKVKILVNPSPDPYVVSLEKSYETIEGKNVSNVTVDPHTGIVLLDPNSSP